MRTWSVFLLLLATTAAGCLDSLPEAPTTEDPDEPAPQTGLGPGNATLYLHADGGDLWMDTESGAGDVLTGTHTAATPVQTHRFPLRPAPERDVVLSGTVDVHLDVATSNIVGDSPVFEAALFVDGEEVDRRTAPGPSLVLDGGELWPAGSDVELRVCVCPAAASVTYNYALGTDGDSLVVLGFPVADGDDGDGAPGDSRSGEVTVSRQGTQWVARRTDTHRESTTAMRADVSLAAAVGGVTVQPGQNSDLRIELSATGDSEQQARDRLEAMIVDYTVNKGATFVLDAGVRVPDQDWTGRSAILTLGLGPRELVALDVDSSTGSIEVGAFTGGTWNLDSSTGEVTVRGVEVERLDVDTSTGDAVLEGTFGTLGVDQSTGDLDLTGTVDDLTVDGSTGSIDADIRAAASGSWSIDSSTGRITLRVPEDASRGYDATADTSTGDITFTFSDASPVGEQEDDHQHVRTNGYDGRSIKTALELSTSTADIRAGSS